MYYLVFLTMLNFGIFRLTGKTVSMTSILGMLSIADCNKLILSSSSIIFCVSSSLIPLSFSPYLSSFKTLFYVFHSQINIIIINMSFN